MSDSSVTMQDLIDANRARHDQNHKEDAVKIAQLWEAIEGLIREGFPVEHTTWHATNLSVDVEIGDLPRIRRAVGKVKVWYKDVAYDQGKPLADRIQVVLRAESCPSLHIRYTKTLPAMEHSPRKCRIVTTSRVETSTQLVCDVS